PVAAAPARSPILLVMAGGHLAQPAPVLLMQSLTLQEGIQQRPDLRRTVALARELANESPLLRDVILSLWATCRSASSKCLGKVARSMAQFYSMFAFARNCRAPTHVPLAAHPASSCVTRIARLPHIPDISPGA
ncbi:MAG: hypothetical protein ACJ8D4_07710, partial [Xanthobacteraceae bacterium]